MNRAAIRLATAAVLSGMGKPPFPTIAGKRVFDSRYDEMSDVLPELMPAVVIYTDEDASQRLGNGLQLNRSVNLHLEISLTSWDKDADGNVVVGWPSIDADLESLLDFFEWQVGIALTGASPLARWWQGLFYTTASTSTRIGFKPAENTIRIAARDMGFAVRLQQDCQPAAYHVGDPVPVVEVLGLWKTVSDKILADGTEALRANVTRLNTMISTQGIPQATAYPPLKTVGMVTRFPYYSPDIVHPVKLGA
jgi:hypothetical protein